MLNFLGITRHLSTTAGYAKRIGWLLREDVTQSPFPVAGVSFMGTVKTEQGDLPIIINHGEQENYLELTFPALPIGRWPYAIHAQDESGEDLRLFAGYIGAVESVAPIESSTVYDLPVMGITVPIEVGRTIKAQWLSNTAATLAAQQAQSDASGAHTDAETATKAATTATNAADAATERAREAEGHAASADASKVAAASSADAAAASASAAAKDARTSSDAREAVEWLAATWPQTVSNGEQAIGAAQDAAVAVIRTKQSDAVLAVGRASQTAQQSVAGAQSAAVASVQDAQSAAETSVGELVQQAADASASAQTAKGEAESAAERASASATNAASSATAAEQALAAMPVDADGNMTLPGNLTAQGGTFARTVNANGGVNIPVDPVTAGDAVNLAHLPMSIFAPCQPIIPLKSLWASYGSVEDTAGGIHIKDVVAGAFGGVCTRVMQWSDYASTATILTVITLTGGNGANVLIDAAYNPNAGVSITPVTSPDKAFLPNAVQLSLFETRQDTTVTGRLVGVDGASVEFSVLSRESHSCVYRIFMLETGGVIKFYLGKFTSGMFDGGGDVLARPEYLAETTVPNNPMRFCFLGIAGIQGGEGNSFPGRIPAISDVRRYYGKWLLNLFR